MIFEVNNQTLSYLLAFLATDSQDLYFLFIVIIAILNLALRTLNKRLLVLVLQTT